MPSANLPFEFGRRWRQIGDLLVPNPTPDQQEAFKELELNDRDLEEFLAKPAPAAGTVNGIVVKVAPYANFIATSTFTPKLFLPSPADNIGKGYVISAFAGYRLPEGTQMKLTLYQHYSGGSGFRTAGWYSNNGPGLKYATIALTEAVVQDGSVDYVFLEHLIDAGSAPELLESAITAIECTLDDQT